jgi:hypothetical protein
MLNPSSFDGCTTPPSPSHFNGKTLLCGSVLEGNSYLGGTDSVWSTTDRFFPMVVDETEGVPPSTSQFTYLDRRSDTSIDDRRTCGSLLLKTRAHKARSSGFFCLTPAQNTGTRCSAGFHTAGNIAFAPPQHLDTLRRFSRASRNLPIRWQTVEPLLV